MPPERAARRPVLPLPDPAAESWTRAAGHVFEHARADTGRGRVAVAGCSFGGYHDWPLWWDMFPRYLAKL